MILFAERKWDARMPGIERYRERYRAEHGSEAPPVLTCDFSYCDENAERGEERAAQYLGSYLGSLLEHYELMGEHFAEIEGSQGYGTNAELLRAVESDLAR